MLFALYIWVNEKPPPITPTHSVHCSLNTPAARHKPPLKSANSPSPLFRRLTHSPPKSCFFMEPLPPPLKIRFFSNIKIIILKFFIVNPIPSFKSN